MQRIANPSTAVRFRFAPPSFSLEDDASLNAGVAQLVERNLAKVEVASSRLVSRSNFFPRRLAIENLFCTWDNAFVCV